jgi:SAM-dependent methyltransferase
MTLREGELTATGLVQQRLWGSDPEGWALFGEPHNRPLFEALLDATGVRQGTHLLDVGCGTGLTLVLAAARGATVSGVDVTPGLLEIAEQRLPESDLWQTDMEHLPFEDSAFDVVVGANAFQFAGDPRRALVEAARVLRPGGAIAVSMFAEPERSESTALHLAMSALSPPERQASHAPYALSDPGQLEAALDAAAFGPAVAEEVVCVWRYGRAADAVRGLLSSAGATRAVEDVGRDAVEAVIESALEPFTDAAGIVSMRNVFRLVSASKPWVR